MKKTSTLSVLLFCTAAILLFACNAHKTTEVKFTNNQGSDCGIKIEACNLTFNVPAQATGSTTKHVWDWSTMPDSTSQFAFSLIDANGNTILRNYYGAFEHGELFNYIDVEAKNNELRIKIEN